MTSVVIAAYNERAVIGSALSRLLDDAHDLDVTVVANGCTDDTAAIASSFGVRVVELVEAGKARALDAGDAVAVGFPRIYLDADVSASGETVDALRAALGTTADGHSLLAVAPARALVLTGRPWPVRCYFAIHRRLPATQHGLYGRGMIALTQAGRSRFDRFPDMVADDLFIDSLFTQAEKTIVSDVHTLIETPRTTRALIRRLTRVRQGNAAMRSANRSGQIHVRASQRTAWLRPMLRRPSLAPATAVYGLITVLAAARARTGPSSWGHDESTRA